MVVSLTYLLADPIDTLYANFLGADMGSYVNTYRDIHIPVLRQATIIVFALGCASPFGWMIAKVFEKESEYNPYEYNFGRRFR
jgi:hypothetical protein